MHRAAFVVPPRASVALAERLLTPSVIADRRATGRTRRRGHLLLHRRAKAGRQAGRTMAHWQHLAHTHLVTTLRSDASLMKLSHRERRGGEVRLSCRCCCCCDRPCRLRQRTKPHSKRRGGQRASSATTLLLPCQQLRRRILCRKYLCPLPFVGPTLADDCSGKVRHFFYRLLLFHLLGTSPLYKRPFLCSPLTIPAMFFARNATNFFLPTARATKLCTPARTFSATNVNMGKVSAACKSTRLEGQGVSSVPRLIRRTVLFSSVGRSLLCFMTEER